MSIIHQNMYDFRGASGLSRIVEPPFAKVIKPKAPLSAKLLSSSSIKSFTGIIDGAQKILHVYNEATPIIKQAKPMIDNIRTTFKVAKAFKRFSGTTSLEQAFDHLPDYEETKKETQKIEEKEKIENHFTSQKEDNSIPAPFYPVL